MKTLHLEFDPTGDWSISSSARENNPDDWLPGQPLRFAVRGYAEYRGGSAHEKHWSSTLRITWNYGLERNVDDCDTGLVAVQDDLKDLIAARSGLF